MPKRNDLDYMRDYDRELLRAAVASLFWGFINERRRRGSFTFQRLAEALGVNKSVVSRWFSKDPPNFELDTIADIADALNLNVHISAVDRATGEVYSAAGLQTNPNVAPTTSTDPTRPPNRISTADAGREDSGDRSLNISTA